MKFYRIAREGKTVDNREITATQIDEMAESYNPDIYSARVWLEHFRGLFPDSVFKALGDVVALKADTDDTGKRVLLAQISPTAELVQMNQERQKIFTSVEIHPNFSDTGKAYLTGLAVTDSPASTGTEALRFSVAQNDKTHLFSEFSETELNFSTPQSGDDVDVDGAEESPASAPSFLDKVKNMFNRQNAVIEKQSTEVQQLFGDMREAVEFGIGELQNANSQQAQEITALQDAFNELESQFNTLKEELDNTPSGDNFSRPLATGGEGDVQTDC